MKMPYRTISISLILVILLLILSATIAFAAPPLGFHMEVDEFIYADGEPFLASGPAVVNGVICDTGIVFSSLSTPVGPSQGNFTMLNIRKQFDCAGGGDTFFINMKVKLYTSGFTTANWKFDGGTGVYTNLKGNGKLVGDPTLATNDILDKYDGKVK